MSNHHNYYSATPWTGDAGTGTFISNPQPERQPSPVFVSSDGRILPTAHPAPFPTGSSTPAYSSSMNPPNHPSGPSFAPHPLRAAPGPNHGTSYTQPYPAPPSRMPPAQDPGSVPPSYGFVTAQRLGMPPPTFSMEAPTLENRPPEYDAHEAQRAELARRHPDSWIPLYSGGVLGCVVSHSDGHGGWTDGPGAPR